MAELWTVFSACCTAPVPRPPQPIKPILISSLPKACAARATFRPPPTAPPATNKDEALIKSRREVALAVGGTCFRIEDSPGTHGCAQRTEVQRYKSNPQRSVLENDFQGTRLANLLGKLPGLTPSSKI
jgi:hypothetical protein